MKLNQRELDIIKILNSSDQALTSAQIVNGGEGLTQSTVQAVTRKLMAAGQIEVQGITYSGNVLSRTFGLTERSKEILNEWFLQQLRAYKSVIGLRVLIEGMLEIDKEENNEDNRNNREEEYIEVLENLLLKLKGQAEQQ